MEERKTIMIIDDSEADQFLNKTIIHQHAPSIIVIEAYDGEEALEILKKQDNAPDLILLDINMPRMDGFEFLDIYKESLAAPPKVIIMSSSNQKNDISRAKQYDCVIRYAEKPLTKDLLKELL